MRRDRLWLVVGLLSVAVWRFVQIRSLELPAWVDAVHHSLLARVLLEQRHIPDTWGPYLPDVPLYYHFGFHLTAALVAWLSGWHGVDLGRAVLVTGQLWQIALAAGVYALALRLWKAPTKALTALLLVGFVSTLPAYYVAWSRYTLLAGLALLVWGMTAALAARPVLVAVTLAASAVTHYYAFVLLVAFLVFALALGEGGARLRLAAGTAAGLLLGAPWLLRVWIWTRAFARHARSSGAAGASSESAWWSLLGPTRNHLLLLLAAAGLCLVIVRTVSGSGRRAGTITGVDPRVAAPFLAWTLLSLALLLAQLGPFRPQHAALVLFLPAVLLAAEAIHELLPSVCVWPVVLGLVLWGGVESADLVARETTFVRPDDMTALRWIDRSVAPEARFLVDVEPWMGVWRGTDGGWWITPLTGRQTVLPPLAYTWGAPERMQPIRETGRRVHALAGLPGSAYCDTLLRLMKQTSADYYYTHSPRPGTCAALGRVFRSSGGLGIYTRQSAPAEGMRSGS
jgi:hypothetical protein